MPGRRRSRRVAGTAVAVLAVAVLAACSSSSTASTTSQKPASAAAALAATNSAHHRTGIVWIVGSTTNVNTSTIPLTASGLFSAHGSITLGNGGPKAGTGKLVFSNGNLNVYHTAGKVLQAMNLKTCAFAQVNEVTYTITGGTGPYAGARGSGAATVAFFGVGPKLKNGQCNQSNSALPLWGYSTFTAAGPVTLTVTH
jgi:hypothetical protein